MIVLYYGDNIATLTVHFTGIPDEVLHSLVKQGYAKTKADALRYALVHLGEELDLVRPRLHAKAELYAYKEIRGK